MKLLLRPIVQLLGNDVHNTCRLAVFINCNAEQLLFVLLEHIRNTTASILKQFSNETVANFTNSERIRGGKKPL